MKANMLNMPTYTGVQAALLCLPALFNMLAFLLINKASRWYEHCNV